MGFDRERAWNRVLAKRICLPANYTTPYTPLVETKQPRQSALAVRFSGAGDGNPDLLRKSEPSQSQIAQAIS